METLKPKSVGQLLTQIQENTLEYLKFFSEQSLPEPSFENGDGLARGQQLPMEFQVARDAALEATDELHRLLLGPLGLLMSCPGDHYLMLGVQYIYRYKLAQHVPLLGEATFEAIAVAAGLDVKDVTRFLRLATRWHVFHETSRDTIVHTAASRQLLDNPDLEAWINNIAEEFWPSLSRTVDATQRWPGSEEPNESGYSLSHDTNENPFDIIKRNPVRQQRFMDVQRFSHQHPSFSMTYLLTGYDFGSAHVVVDVGGAYGMVAMALARKHLHLKVVVQDQPHIIKGLRERIPTDLKDRVRGMEHDFFRPQPVKGADVYLLRWVLHDWSDKYCIKILQAQVPGLKKGAKVVINDICIPEPGQVGIAADRGLRQMDISMKAFNNARERDYATWSMLFTAADPNFEFLGITLPEGARMAIIQAVWTGEES
ncbi:S-adenosyl-L-methionine-dependent methyltransferase [Annulohypoxylon stygium]|nr:S-adenosyl-L-methionine-dependent methyltransferase [Annulohypoxylon stygium]